MRWSRRAWLKACALATASVACAPRAAAPAAPAPSAAESSRPAAGPAPSAPPRVNATVKVGYTRNLSSGPTFLALERGYFREVGINAESVIFQSGSEMVAGLGTGELALGQGALSPGLYNAWGRDIRVLVVADAGTLRPGYGSTWIMVRRDLADQIRSFADLRGRRVSASTEGSVIDYVLRNGLRQEGLTLGDVDLVRLASPDMLAAFQGGALEVGGSAEAFATQIVDLGLAVKWINGSDVIPGESYSALMMSEQAAADRPLAEALLYAFLQGAREYLVGQTSDPAVLAVVEKYTGVPQDVIRRATPSFLDPNGTVQIDRIRAHQDFWLSEGVMQRPVDPTPFVNTEFAAAAVRLLGRAPFPPASSG
jgi:NitT/TauT family transport system substrate-binding protein